MIIESEIVLTYKLNCQALRQLKKAIENRNLVVDIKTIYNRYAYFKAGDKI